MAFSSSSPPHDCDNSNMSKKPRLGDFSSRWKKFSSMIHRPGSLKSIVPLKKKSSPCKIGGSDTQARISAPQHTKLLSLQTEISTSQIFSNMFMAYRLNHRAYKSKRFILKNLNEQYSGNELEVRKEVNTHNPLSVISFRLYDNNDLESLALSSVSSMTMQDAGHYSLRYCRSPNSFLEWIVDSVSCYDHN